MGQRIVVGKVTDIPVGQSYVVAINQKKVAIFNVDGKLYAIDDMCMHMGASLAGGSVENGWLVCPWHHWRFRLADGGCAHAPKVKTGSYPVHVVGDEVQLELPE